MSVSFTWVWRCRTGSTSSTTCTTIWWRRLIEGDGERAAQLTEAALRGGQKKVMEALSESAAQVSVARMDLGP